MEDVVRVLFERLGSSLGEWQARLAKHSNHLPGGGGGRNH